MSTGLYISKTVNNFSMKNTIKNTTFLCDDFYNPAKPQSGPKDSQNQSGLSHALATTKANIEIP